MKKYIVVSIFPLLMACGNTDEISANNTETNEKDSVHTATPVSKEESIEHINKKVEQIDLKTNGSSAITRSVENENFCGNTDQGCELTGHFFNDKCILLKAWFGFTNGYTERYYYLENESLIFAKEITYNFTLDMETGSFNYDQPTIKFEGKYYFTAGKMFHEWATGHNRCDSDEIDCGIELIKESKEYLSKINQSNE